MSRKRPFCNITNNIDEKTYVLNTNTVKKVNLELQEDKDVNRIQVYVRIRPENDKESSSTNIKSVLHVIDNKNMIFDPREDGLNTYFYHGKVFKEVGKKPNKNLAFSFDQVFNTNSTNQQVFEVTTKGLIDSLLEGCNCTVFAYGATGSGKTHTIIGNEREPGVIYLTVMELFQKIKSSNELEISISYLEIYNESVYDLLAPTTGKSLAVREDCKRGVVVANLSTHYPEDANHLINMIKIGNNNRAKQATNANSQSSRSHAIFQIFIEKHDYSSPHTMSIQLSKMSLIDLAGSERASVAYKGKRSQSLQREGSNINKSLLSLGNCINALATKKGNKSQYVPYRNSKLTLLLRDSLNGNCRTAMIAAISPTSICFEDTHNTLSYANRAMGISFNYKPSTITINSKESKNRDVLDAENQRLKQEIEKLKHDLKNLNESKNFLPFTKKLELLSLFDKRFELRKKYLEYESNIKKCTLRRMFKKAFYESSIELSNEQDFNLESNLDLKSIEDEINYYENLKNEQELKMNESQSLIDDCIDSIKLKLPDDNILEDFLSKKQLEFDLKEEKFINKLSVELNKLVLSYYNHYEVFKKETISLIKFLNSSDCDNSQLQIRISNLKKVMEEH